MEKKPDRRTHRTRRQLREAMLSLVLEQGYESVTIEDITDRADLGRTTFYLHYRDKEELLFEAIEEMVADLRNQIYNMPVGSFQIRPDTDGSQLEGANPIFLVFQHAAEHANLYRIILRGEGTAKVSRRMREFISNAVSEFTQIRSARVNIPLQPTVPLVFFSNYIAGAMIGSITWWLENDMPYPPEEIAVMFQKVLVQNIQQVLGLTGAAPQNPLSPA